MAATGLDTFDTTLQKTNIWLKEIMEFTGWNDRNKAYIALRSVLHALRDRLAIEEAAHLGAELPLLLRGVFYDGWSPSGKPIKMNREEFLLRVAKAFRDDPDIDPGQAVQAVFNVMEKRISEGEIADIKNILPQDLRDLWRKQGN